MPKQTLEIGATIVVSKPELDTILLSLSNLEYDLEGPKVKDHTVILGPIQSISDLPKGYTSQEEPGKYTLSSTGMDNYFDVTSGPQAWKKYIFPSRAQLMIFQQDPDKSPDWTLASAVEEIPSYALIGVRPCDLAGIHIQDKIFLEGDRCDPIYRDRREKAFILAANWHHIHLSSSSN